MNQLSFSFFKAAVKRWFRTLKLFFTEDPGEHSENLAREAFAESLLDSALELKGIVAKAAQLQGYVSGHHPGLSILFDHIPPSLPEVAVQVFQETLGKRPQEVFQSWEDQAFAAASLGEVHGASDHQGHDLAVKVQHPGIAETVFDQLQSPESFSYLVGEDLAKSLSPVAKELLHTVLLQEVDYEQEALWLREFRKAWESQTSIIIPKVYENLSGRRVLTMDRLRGESILSFCERAPVEERDSIARELFRFGYGSVIQHGLLYADPNPGNFLVLPGQTLGVVDFGSCWRIPEDTLTYEQVFWQSLLAEDAESLRYTLYRAGFVKNAALLDSATYRQWENTLRLPFASSRFLFSQSYASQLQSDMQAFARMPEATIPLEFLLMWRQRIGLTAILGKIGGSVDFRSLLFTMLNDVGMAPLGVHV